MADEKRQRNRLRRSSNLELACFPKRDHSYFDLSRRQFPGEMLVLLKSRFFDEAIRLFQMPYFLSESFGLFPSLQLFECPGKYETHVEGPSSAHLTFSGRHVHN
jgi:hypothetical protein